METKFKKIIKILILILLGLIIIGKLIDITPKIILLYLELTNSACL